METWWQRYPQAFEAEKSALDALGWPWTIDQAAFDEGRLVITIDGVTQAGTELRFTSEYPATYPYFQPHVSLKEVVFARHQHPIGKNLCLLAREGEDWRPGHDTLATLIRDQLPLVEAINSSSGTAQPIIDQEDHVGEPLSSFLNYLPNSALIVPDEAPLHPYDWGKLEIWNRPFDVEQQSIGLLNGVISTIQDERGKPLCARCP